MKLLTYFAAGALFALGLVISGMTQPSKVIGFLDWSANWDPSLALVMGGAVGLNLLTYRRITERTRPLLGGKFHLPTRKDVDPKLVAGAGLFGAGWGLAGYCPGPALASAVTLSSNVLVFLGTMTLGMIVYGFATGEYRLPSGRRLTTGLPPEGGPPLPQPAE